MCVGSTETQKKEVGKGLPEGGDPSELSKGSGSYLDKSSVRRSHLSKSTGRQQRGARGWLLGVQG